MSELDRHFRPEFLNRLDDIIMFHSLAQDDIVRIVDIQLGGWKDCWRTRRITMELTTPGKDYLAERGFDPVYGARPLKRAIQRELQDTLANAILNGQVHEGDHVVVDMDGKYSDEARLTFTTVERQTCGKEFTTENTK